MKNKLTGRIPKKGEKGYIAWQRRFNILLTAAMYLLAVGIYLLGYLTMHTNKNLWTVIAVLSILPASKNAVRMIMFLRVSPTREAFYERLAPIEKGLPVLYDLIFTTYEKAYVARALVYGGGNICVCSVESKDQAGKLTEHLESMIREKYSGLSVKVFTDEEAFFLRASEILEHFGEKESGKKEGVDFSALRRTIEAMVL
ncbi:MAG: hypothetical protein IJT16_08160 [Lachnospiraceae bacterium]|nr:hypothetical protein [Lachnospiraceae bacterium]